MGSSEGAFLDRHPRRLVFIDETWKIATFLAALRNDRAARQAPTSSRNPPHNHLEASTLRAAHLEGAELYGAHLEGGQLHGAHLEDAQLREAHLEGATLDEAHLEGSWLDEAHLEGAQLNQAHLVGASVIKAHLEGVRLIGAHLEGARLHQTHLEGARLLGARLEGAEFYRAHLEDASLSEAYLCGASFQYAHFEGADLNVSALDDAMIDCADLVMARGLRQANIDTAWGNAETKLPGTLVRPVHERWLSAEFDNEAAADREDRWRARRDRWLPEAEKRRRAKRDGVNRPRRSGDTPMRSC